RTSTGADARALAASRPPKPPPTITTRGRGAATPSAARPAGTCRRPATGANAPWRRWRKRRHPRAARAPDALLIISGTARLVRYTLVTSYFVSPLRTWGRGAPLTTQERKHVQEIQRPGNRSGRGQPGGTGTLLGRADAQRVRDRPDARVQGRALGGRGSRDPGHDRRQHCPPQEKSHGRQGKIG